MLVMGLSQLAHAQKFDPNAPEKKTVTVGSEIDRGVSTVFNATLRYPAYQLDSKDEAIEKVLEENKQRNTDTDGFLLGANFQAWQEMMTLARLDSRLVNTRIAASAASRYFDRYRKLQGQMGMDDETLCDLAGKRYEALKPEIEKWSKLK